MFKFKSKLVATFLIGSVVLSGCATKVDKVAAEKIDQYDVVIVGGGIAGLTAGYFLQDEDVLILEKKGTVGGRTISGMHESFTYAKGTEYLGTPDSPLAEMIEELGLVPKEIPSPMDAYFDGGKFYYGSEGIKRYLVTNSDYDSYLEFVELLLSEHEDYEEIPDIDYDEYMEYLDYITAREWLIENDIPEVYINKYNVSSKGLFGATLDEISALSFIPEAAYDYEEEDLEDDYDYDEFYESFDEEDFEEEYVEATNEKSGSYSFAKGLTELTDALSEHLAEHIKLNSDVQKITKKGRNYFITYVDENNQKTVVSAKKVVLAVPSPEALNIASDVLSKDRINIMKEINYSSYATVALFSETPIFDQAFDLAVPDDYFFTDIYDATWIERYYDQDKKDLEEYIVSVYVAPKTSNDHAIDVMSDQELLENVYNDLDKIFDSASQKVTGYDIERFPYAYPVMSPGAYERLLELDELNYGSLILAGDYMMYPTFEAAVESGYLAAERIIEGY